MVVANPRSNIFKYQKLVSYASLMEVAFSTPFVCQFHSVRRANNVDHICNINPLSLTRKRVFDPQLFRSSKSIVYSFKWFRGGCRFRVKSGKEGATWRFEIKVSIRDSQPRESKHAVK